MYKLVFAYLCTILGCFQQHLWWENPETEEPEKNFGGGWGFSAINCQVDTKKQPHHLEDHPTWDTQVVFSPWCS